MSLVAGFCNQSAILQRKTGRNVDNEPTYSDPAEISARVEPAEGLRRSATGDLIDVETYVLTETGVAVGDCIDGEEVRRVQSIIGKSGQTLGYEAYL